MNSHKNHYSIEEHVCCNRLPVQMMRDSGPNSFLKKCQFLAANGVMYIHSAPYHPVTKGAAERLLQ